MTENIQHLRLINGEELVVTILSETKKEITVDKPMIVQEKRDDLGSSLVLTNYVPFASNKKCKLQKDHIISFNDLHPELVKYYHNSLKIADQYEIKMIEEIARANGIMEQLFDQEKNERSNIIDLNRVVKTNNKLH